MPHWGTSSEFQRGEGRIKTPHDVIFHVFLRHTFLLPVEIRNSCLSEARVCHHLMTAILTMNTTDHGHDCWSVRLCELFPREGACSIVRGIILIKWVMLITDKTAMGIFCRHACTVDFPHHRTLAVYISGPFDSIIKSKGGDRRCLAEARVPSFNGEKPDLKTRHYVILHAFYVIIQPFSLLKLGTRRASTRHRLSSA